LHLTLPFGGGRRNGPKDGYRKRAIWRPKKKNAAPDGLGGLREADIKTGKTYDQHFTVPAELKKKKKWLRQAGSP